MGALTSFKSFLPPPNSPAYDWEGGGDENVLQCSPHQSHVPFTALFCAEGCTGITPKVCACVYRYICSHQCTTALHSKREFVPTSSFMAQPGSCKGMYYSLHFPSEISLLKLKKKNKRGKKRKGKARVDSARPLYLFTLIVHDCRLVNHISGPSPHQAATCFSALGRFNKSTGARKTEHQSNLVFKVKFSNPI